MVREEQKKWGPLLRELKIQLGREGKQIPEMVYTHIRICYNPSFVLGLYFPFLLKYDLLLRVLIKLDVRTLRVLRNVTPVHRPDIVVGLEPVDPPYASPRRPTRHERRTLE